MTRTDNSKRPGEQAGCKLKIFMHIGLRICLDGDLDLLGREFSSLMWGTSDARTGVNTV